MIKNIFISPNPKKDCGLKTTKKIIEVLNKYECSLYLPKAFSEYGFSVNLCDSCPHFADLVVVIGGDGSFIDASVDAIKFDIPIIGVNLGKVGYLSEVAPSELDVFGRLFSADYKIDEKLLLEVSVSNNEPIARLAVNDVVISHSDYLGIADFVIYSNEGGVRYRADGAVISTPAGSTAYSLSAGGPVVSHNANAIIVTPIAPHSFFNRSIVFGSDDCIKIKNTGEVALNISVDGRLCGTLAPDEKCTVKSSVKKIKVLTFKDNNMFATLFGKMQILEDVL